MKVLVIILAFIFFALIGLSVVLNILETRKRKKNVQEFLLKCDEKQLAFINEYDKCYKVGLRDLWKKKQK